MLLTFFERLRAYEVPVSTREMLDCLNLFSHQLLHFDLDDFYYLSRTTLVKDEQYYDRFDRAFDDFFSGLDTLPAVLDIADSESLLTGVLRDAGFSAADIAAALRDYHLKLAAAEKARQEKAGKDTGGADAERDVADAEAESPPELDQEPDAAKGSPEGSGAKEESADPADEPVEEGEGAESGENGEQGDEGEPGESGENGEQGEEGEEGEEGESGRTGKGIDGLEGRGESETGQLGEKDAFNINPTRQAQKLWQLRRFEDYDADVELGTRNLKMALRRVRKFARTGADLELDLHDTIRSTARNGGLLDIKEVPEKHNSVKVLLFLDVGGSMDDHIELCAQLFAAARYEFKHLEQFYFHNFVYESVWPDNARRIDDKLATWDVIRKFGSDYKVIFVGDANMARHEIAERGGSVEHFNGEPGEVWMRRIQDQFRKVVWLNPIPEDRWQDSYSAVMIKRLMNEQMYPLSVDGIDRAARYLVR